MTVSRVLNAPDRVAPDTAERVRAAIEELGYVPNLLAGGLSSRRSRVIAAIVPTIATPVFSACLQAFTDTMDAAGYHVLLGLSGYGDGEEALVTAILGRRPDGLLLTGTARPASTRQRLVYRRRALSSRSGTSPTTPPTWSWASTTAPSALPSRNIICARATADSAPSPPATTAPSRAAPGSPRNCRPGQPGLPAPRAGPRQYRRAAVKPSPPCR